MEILSGLAIYFVIWWLALFIVLPWGVTSAHELGQEVDAGTAKSAPLKPRMGKKFLITTVIAGVIFAGVYAIATQNLFTLDDIPFFPTFRSAND